MNQEKLEEFKPVFYPQSIAVVGASKKSNKQGTAYLEGLLAAGYEGKIYPVHPSEKEISGLEAYPSVSAIPYPVDYVIVCVPKHSVLEVLDDCAGKVKAVQFFTAGFRETGTEEGLRLEEEIARKAREGGFHVVGPNCIGVYSPTARVSCGPTSYMGEPGSVAFISQSGGHAERIIKIGIARGIGFSKGVSFGNGCDLDSVDYLEYLAIDPETKIIAAYLEGVRQGRRFLELIKEISPKKPVVVLKGGKTEIGAIAAASHTGSMDASDVIWSAALKQVGAIKVGSIEELMDTVLALNHLFSFTGRNVALISGLAAGGGGDSVSAADGCISMGLKMPAFTETTRSELKVVAPMPGTILRNPLDLSGMGRNLQILENSLELVAADPNIDVVIVQGYTDDIVGFYPPGTIDSMSNLFIDFRKRQSKPIVIVLPPGLAEAERLRIEKKLSAAQVPVYSDLERAAKALVNVSQYFEFHAQVGKD